MYAKTLCSSAGWSLATQLFTGTWEIRVYDPYAATNLPAGSYLAASALAIP